ncbi:MAG TPA: pitrilysin family protein, partial [Turneriella sp.]|nr:pitrilysin family protein [Turneriella sp.]
MKVEKIRLDNGLTVLLENIPHRTSASVGLYLPIGSRFEKKSESGFSHFVEHMLFKGTKNRDYTEIARAIDRLGGFMNASTGKEMTDYYVTLSGRHLSIALDVISDMFYNSLFSEEEFESEKKVIVEELKMTEDQPDDYLFDLFYRTQLGENSLGRPVGGESTHIERTKRDTLFNYYRTHYGPNGAVLSLAGALFNSAQSKKSLIATIVRFFNRNNHTLAPKIGYKTEAYLKPEFQEKRTVKPKSFKHLPKKLEQVNFVLSLPGIKNDIKPTAEMSVLTHYLGGTMSSRLFTEMREKKGLCYSVSAFHSQYLHEGIWGIFCATSPKKYADAVETAVAEITKLADGISKHEIEESKSGLRGGTELSMESAHRRASFNARSELYYDTQIYWHEYIAAIDRVTPESLQHTLLNLWRSVAPGLTSIGPKSSST